MCPEGLDVKLRGEGLPSLQGPGFSLSTEKGGKIPPGIRNCTQALQTPGEYPSDGITRVWKRLSSGLFEAEAWEEQHPTRLRQER